MLARLADTKSGGRGQQGKQYPKVRARARARACRCAVAKAGWGTGAKTTPGHGTSLDSHGQAARLRGFEKPGLTEHILQRSLFAVAICFVNGQV